MEILQGQIRIHDYHPLPRRYYHLWKSSPFRVQPIETEFRAICLLSVFRMQGHRGPSDKLAPLLSSMADYTLSDYHERSKHRLNRDAPIPGRLDRANQPDPFRRYEHDLHVELPLGEYDLKPHCSTQHRYRMPPPRT